MKYLPVLAAFFCAATHASIVQYSAPVIFIEYASSLDLQVCPSGIAEPVLKEMSEALPRAIRTWKVNETDLLRTTAQLLKKAFLRHEETVSLMICPNLKGQAEPVLIPFWPYLSTTTQGHPFSDKIFVGLIFHELLHRYVDQILGSALPLTPLLQKYANEKLLVRRHLHVDAIQKAVYLKLGRDKEIQDIIVNDSTFLGTEYSRAWEIIDTLEGTAPFLEELTSTP